MKGFQLGFNAIGTIEPRGADPTDRFMRVVAIARELESGRYPQCEWVERAPSLVIQFFVPTNAPISADNVDRMLAAYQEFVISHFALAGSNIADSHLSFVIMTRMGDLHRRKGDEVGGIERVFAELERVAPDPAGMRYLRARYYMRRAAPNEPGRPDMLKKAREALTALANEGGGFYQRNSLATLAALEFAERDWSSARTAFRKYASAYPQSGWSWVASLRAAQCEEASGDPKRAAASFLEVSKKNDLSLARVLAHEYAARAHEAAGDFAAAVVPHQAAIDGWDDDFGPTYSTFVARQRPVDGPFGAPRYEGEVVKAQLPERIAQLTSSLTMPGGALLERGRWLIAAARYDEGIVALQQTVREYPGSPAAAEARRLTAHARLDRALDLADVEKPDADAAAATKELDALGREPFGFAVTAAKIARASMLWTSGAPAEGETLMMEALSEWHAHQRIVPPARGVEEDVAAIRRVVFLPKGGGVYGNLRWNAFSWPSTTLPPFVVVSQDVRVKRHDGSQSRVASVHDLPAAESKVLFFNAEQMAFFHKAMRTLGGTKRRQPGHIMETPNQPVGTSMNMLALWSKFFAARPGHWGGWEIETYPVVTEIEFANAERTKAAARVTVGYSGATIVLEKRSGRWIPVELTDRWVT
jgi:tetratricopeptide (TPR) repeat protein